MRALVARTITLVAAAAALAAPAHAQARAHAQTLVPSATRIDTAADASARWVGVYRLTILATKGDLLDARVLIEPSGAKLTGTLLVDQHASGIADVRLDGDALVATVVTAEGRGTLVMRQVGEDVAGTLTVGKRTWQVNGARAI